MTTQAASITYFGTRDPTERIREANEYLRARTGCYEWRCARYDSAINVMHGLGLNNRDTVFDVGSGWGEFGARLHSWPGTRSRYIPVDAAIDGTDLDCWTPPQRAEFFVCLEVLEHLRDPGALLGVLTAKADRAVIVSTPNPETTDVLGMDPTHRTPITRELLEVHGFKVSAQSFYGKRDDSLFATWTSGTS